MTDSGPSVNRRYLLSVVRVGEKAQDVVEITDRGDDTSRVVVLALPRNTPTVLKSEILGALRRAYQAGREDKAEELLSGKPGHF